MDTELPDFTGEITIETDGSIELPPTELTVEPDTAVVDVLELPAPDGTPWDAMDQVVVPDELAETV